MEGSEFRTRRERLKLTQVQVADRLNVSAATVRNWESGATPISTAVELLWEVWEPRFRQEDPLFGPLTLIYTNGPMFIPPQGPRRPLAMMQQESFQTNAAALARVGVLWGSDHFHSPLIMESAGEVLWNSVQLARVVDRTDEGAPTVRNMVKGIAAYVRSNAWVRTNNPSPDEISLRQRLINEQAEKLVALADADEPDDTNSLPIEEALSWLNAHGAMTPAHLSSGLAAAFGAREIR